MDFNDLSNPDSIQFPSNYSSPFVQTINGSVKASPYWKGIYAKNISVVMPNQWKKDGQPITVGANNLIIDFMGVSGEVYASDLVELCNGNMDGWAFSLDTFAVNVTANRFTGTRINGLLNIPLFSPKTQACSDTTASCRYQAVLTANELSFTLAPRADYTVDLWKGEIVLDNTSSITLKYQNSKFEAKALLNGHLHIRGDFSDNFNVKIPDINFQNLQVSNQAPHLKIGQWTAPTQAGADFGGFEINVDGVGLIDQSGGQGDNVALTFGLQFLLGDKDSSNFAAKGGFRLKGHMETVNNKQRWVYDNFITDSVSINGGFTGCKLAGKLVFFGQDQLHPTFGKGLFGALSAKFSGIDVDIAAVGTFGRKDGYKYFLVDALAKFEPGIPMAPGLNLNGFGGGASWRMSSNGGLTALPANFGNIDPTSLSVGQNLTGTQYTPSASAGLGIRATVVMALIKEKACNINATFGIDFNDNWGINKVYFEGSAYFLQDLKMDRQPEVSQDSTAYPASADGVQAFVYIH